MIQFDFSSIQSRMITRLQSKTSWSAVLPSSTNLRLIDAFAEELADLAQYNEYLVQETKWSLARNVSSLLSAQAIHRYNAHRKTGAVGFIRFAVSDLITSSDWSSTKTYSAGETIYYNDVLYTALQTSLNNIPSSSPSYWSLTNISPLINVDIPKWTVFTDSSGNTKFSTYTAETLTVGQNFIDLPIVQGTPKSYTATSTGLNNEEFLISDVSVENNVYELYINNILWTKVESLLDYTSTDKVYEIENKLDFSGIYLKFGDDTNGKKLSNGDALKFNYISTDGSTGNVNSTNIIVKISYTIYDTNGSAVTAYVTNMDSLLGGLDYEDIESVRLRAPRIFQTGDRASSSEDYQAIIQDNFNFVLKANVWGAYEYNIDNGLDPWTFIPVEENVVNVAVISTGEVNITDSQKLLISEGINEFKAPTDIVIYNPVRFINLVFRTIAYVSNTTYTLSSVVNNINNLLSSNYSVSALDLFQNIYFSDYQTLIDSAAGVDHHTTYAEIYYDFSFSSAYVSSIVLPSTNIRPTSMRIYLEDTVTSPGTFTLIATDDGNGNFVSEDVVQYIFTNSSINYNTGQGTIQLSGTAMTQPFADYNIRIFYRLASDDLILLKRFDIFKYDTSNSSITAQYLRR